MIIVHHTASFTTMEKSIESETRKWWKIPYHYLIWNDWEIRQMREISENPGATKNPVANREWIQIALIWNFNISWPSEEQKISLRKLIAKYKLPVKTHREVWKTACPGKYFSY